MHKKGYHLCHARLDYDTVAIFGTRQSCTNKNLRNNELQIHMQDPVASSMEAFEGSYLILARSCHQPMITVIVRII